jgi:hypothetical protein
VHDVTITNEAPNYHTWLFFLFYLI